MKVIAFYLPQYHDDPLNSKWWGKGFTEWTNVKKAKPLFENHYQPRIPENGNYYNLLDNNATFKWQIELAKKYGVYGFCFYHYWFDGTLLLNQPTEAYLNDSSLDFPFCICWANENWKRTWGSSSGETLIVQHYGDETMWKAHFDYLLPFFKDPRYIMDSSTGMPLLVLYRPDVIPRLNEMLDYWNELAKKEGLKGLCYAYQHVSFDLCKDKDDSRFTYNIEYQPQYAFSEIRNQKFKILKRIRRNMLSFIEKKFSIDLRRATSTHTLQVTDYDDVWQRILRRTPESDKNIPGAFVDWDNTVRMEKTGSVCNGASPEKFGKYFSQQLVRAKEVYKKDMIFIFAWNEWGESGYLEPDEKYGSQYLEMIKQALLEQKEFEE